MFHRMDGLERRDEVPVMKVSRSLALVVLTMEATRAGIP
jgi:hypothetical protein